jgi:3-dehydroquinate dehydratase type I
MICISICSHTQKKAFRDIQRSLPLCDLLELRMDRIEDGNLAELLQYIQDFGQEKPVLVTYRKTTENLDHKKGASDKDRKTGEADESKRWEILQEAVRLGAAYVDVELEDDNIQVRKIAALIEHYGHRTKLICSHHDFSETPALPQLKKLCQACLEKGADIVKIVPYASSMDDNLRVLELLSWAKKQGTDVVAFGMGEKGRISRVAAPLFGALFTFASLDDRSAAAPGQIAAGDMRKILGILRKKEM